MLVPQPEKDIRIKITTRNARILRRIERTGLSVRKFCDKFQLPYTTVSSVIGLKKSPIRKNGDWLPIAWFISSALRCEPEELWPEWMRAIERRRATLSIDVAIPETVTMIDDRVFDIPKMLGFLTPKEREVVQRHIGMEEKLDDIGEDFGVSRTRILQICDKALRKIKHHFDTEGWKHKTRRKDLVELHAHFELVKRQREEAGANYVERGEEAEKFRERARDESEFGIFGRNVIGKNIILGEISFKVLKYNPQSHAVTCLAYHETRKQSRICVMLWEPSNYSLGAVIYTFLEKYPWPEAEEKREVTELNSLAELRDVLKEKGAEKPPE